MDIEVKSDIAGTVWKIERRAGDTVAEDDPLIILESMKMEIPVASPVGGTVKEMRVALQDTVEEDQVIALITPRS